jgi:hypothetical protein
MTSVQWAWVVVGLIFLPPLVAACGLVLREHVRARRLIRRTRDRSRRAELERWYHNTYEEEEKP